MATGTNKFLNYNGLVKLIGLIKSAMGFKTNTFVKSIAGYGTSAAPSSTSGVNDTKNKLEGTYTTGALDGSGTDVTTNKFTYIDTTYGNASSTKAGLMSSSHWSIVDALDDAAASSKGSTLVGYGKSINGSTRTTVTDALDALESEVGSKIDDVKQDNVSVVTNGVANIPHDILQCAFDFSHCEENDTVVDAYYNVLLQGAEDHKAVKCADSLVFVETSGQNTLVLTGATSNGEAGVRYVEINKTTKKVTTVNELSESTLATTLSGYVPTSRKVNNIALTSDITIKSQDVPLTSNITIGGASKTNVQEALVALNTAAANAGNVDDVKVNGTSVVSNKDALIVIKENGQNLQVVSGEVNIVATTGIYLDDAELALLPESSGAKRGYITIPAVANEEYVGDASDTDGILTSDQYGGIWSAIEGVSDDVETKVSGVTVNGSSVVDSNTKIAAISAVTGIKNNGDSSYQTGQLIVKKINGTALVGTGTLADITINSSIGLSSNITVDGTSKSTVQDALTALNTLAAANKTAIQSIQSVGLTRTIVTSLPTTNISETTIYMILASNDTLNGSDPSTSASSTPYSSNNNSYNEYMYINSAWERIGSTEVNLDVDPITNDEIDTAWATTSAAA